MAPPGPAVGDGGGREVYGRRASSRPSPRPTCSPSACTTTCGLPAAHLQRRVRHGRRRPPGSRGTARYPDHGRGGACQPRHRHRARGLRSRDPRRAAAWTRAWWRASWAEFDYGLFASPAYVAAAGALETPEALGAHDDPLERPGCAPRLLHHPQRAAPVRVEGQPRLRVNTGAAVRSAVLQGLGVAPLPTVMARAYVAQGQLQRLLAPWHPASVPVYAVYPRSRHLSPKVRAFVDLALSAFSAAESGRDDGGS
ncbi:MAG: LysR substrate-binding domain-containing protein [bacterium]